MNIEKLIERLKAKDFERDYDCTPFECGVFGLLDTAATALSTLQAENEKLRAELENYRKGHCSEGGCAAEKDRGLVIAENERLRAELEQVKLENNALWTYIEIVDREYQRYMDRGYIDRLDELRRTWRRGPKED